MGECEAVFSHDRKILILLGDDFATAEKTMVGHIIRSSLKALALLRATPSDYQPTSASAAAWRGFIPRPYWIHSLTLETFAW
jgi:hypothetical protein